MVVVVLALLLPLAAAQPWQFCGSNARYSPNSTYQDNLNSISTVLPHNASSSPTLFATAAQGGEHDPIFALTICRGDIDAPACLDCVAGAFQYARGSCPFDKEVAVLYDVCFLYFSGQDFLNTTANVGQITLYNTQNVSGRDDPRSPGAAFFTGQAYTLLNGAALWAAYNTSRRFVTARIYNGSVPIPVPMLYSLTQCTPDMSAGDCWGCLRELIGKSPLSGRTVGARVAGVRCSYRYENYAFYRGEPMLNLGTPPPFTEPTGGQRAGKKRKLRIVAIVVPPLVAILLCALCFGWVRRQRKTSGNENLHEQPKTNLSGEDVSMLWRIQETGSEFTVFDFSQIVEATSDFSEEHKLGQGGFGSVYKVHDLCTVTRTH